MKKLAVTQIVLGTLIVVSFFLFLEYVVPGYCRQEIIDAEGNVIGFVSGLHKPNVLLDIWTFIYPALGLAVLGCGIAQLIQARHNSISKELTIAQITLGVLVLSSLVAFLIWAEPGWRSTDIDSRLTGHPEAVMIRHNPGWVILLTAWKVAAIILGLGITSCSAVQLIKLRGK